MFLSRKKGALYSDSKSKLSTHYSRHLFLYNSCEIYGVQKAGQSFHCASNAVPSKRARSHGVSSNMKTMAGISSDVD